MQTLIRRAYLGAGLLLAAVPAQALPITPEWTCPSNNSAASCAQAIAGLQLLIDETAPGSNQVAFDLTYTGVSGSATEFYWQDLGGLFAGPPVIVNGVGTLFVSGANPPSPPGINPFTVAQAAESTAAGGGIVNNGLQQGDEILRFVFALTPTATPAMVDEQFGDDLSVAVHVVSLVGEFSETLLAVRPSPPSSCPFGGVPPECIPQTNIPEPASKLLLGLALFALGFCRRKKSQDQEEG